MFLGGLVYPLIPFILINNWLFKVSWKAINSYSMDTILLLGSVIAFFAGILLKFIFLIHVNNRNS